MRSTPKCRRGSRRYKRLWTKNALQKEMFASAIPTSFRCTRICRRTAGGWHLFRTPICRAMSSKTCCAVLDMVARCWFSHPVHSGSPRRMARSLRRFRPPVASMHAISGISATTPRRMCSRPARPDGTPFGIMHGCALLPRHPPPLPASAGWSPLYWMAPPGALPQGLGRACHASRGVAVYRPYCRGADLSGTGAMRGAGNT
jgi:hypothetical protein